MMHPQPLFIEKISYAYRSIVVTQRQIEELCLCLYMRCFRIPSFAEDTLIPRNVIETRKGRSLGDSLPGGTIVMLGTDPREDKTDGLLGATLLVGHKGIYC